MGSVLIYNDQVVTVSAEDVEILKAADKRQVFNLDSSRTCGCREMNGFIGRWGHR